MLEYKGLRRILGLRPPPAPESAEEAEEKDPFLDVWPQIDAVEGWLVPGQERWLFETTLSLPEDAVIVEIGSFLGRSTCSMAFACRGTERRIFAIDTFRGNDADFVKGVNNIEWEGDSYHKTFTNNLQVNDLQRYVVPLRGESRQVGEIWAKPIDLLFIDGSHQYEDVLADVEAFMPWVVSGGIVALHDVTPGWPGPFKVWNERVKPHLLDPGQVANLAYGTKP